MISQLPEVPSIATMKTKYKDNHWGTSVKKLPWDERDNITPIEALMTSTMKNGMKPNIEKVRRKKSI